MAIGKAAVTLLILLGASAFRVRPKKRVQEKPASKGAFAGFRPESQGFIVTLGDSYSSGTGIHKNVADYHEGDACCRDFERTPGGRLAREQGKPHLMPACAGDQVPEIRDQFATLQSDYPDEAARGWAGSTMFFTIGGNDIRSNKGDAWPDILVDCILSFYTDCHKKNDNQVANWDELQVNLESFYTSMARGAGNATLRVLGYPRLLQRSWHCIPIPGVNAGATKWMDNMVDSLNAVLTQAVSNVKNAHPSVDLEFVDVTSHLTTGACSLSGVDVHGIVLTLGGGLLSPQTFHPSQKGYDNYYNALASNLDTMIQRAPSSGDPLPWHIDHIFKGWDVNEDGKLSMHDVLQMGGDDAEPVALGTLRKAFSIADKNQDENISLDEFEGFLTAVEE